MREGPVAEVLLQWDQAMLDERGSRSGTAMQNLIQSINSMFIFEVLAWCAPLLFLKKWWVSTACHIADRDGQVFIALGCRSRMFISSKRFPPHVAQSE